jgi:hypothetical protein
VSFQQLIEKRCEVGHGVGGDRRSRRWVSGTRIEPLQSSAMPWWFWLWELYSEASQSGESFHPAVCGRILGSWEPLRQEAEWVPVTMQGTAHSKICGGCCVITSPVTPVETRPTSPHKQDVLSFPPNPVSAEA